MAERKHNMINRGLTVTVLVLMLLAVRAFEDKLFYDPFLSYFKNDYLGGPFPKYDSFSLFLGLGSRYCINTFLSVAIIYVLFKDQSLLYFTVGLYVFFFVLLIAAFFALLHFESKNAFLLFYTRRFLIQPLFLLLFVPAFYYQKRISKK